MTAISEIEPRTKSLIIDLVEAADVNVDAWRHSALGASNPKYCYEWAFVQPGKVVVLSLWHEDMIEFHGTIIQRHNMRVAAQKALTVQQNPIWNTRARRVDDAFALAYRANLPIRVIVCVGQKRNTDDSGAKASRVKYRALDPTPWTVAKYDAQTGDCMLMRGASPHRFVDQFSVESPDETAPISKRPASGSVYGRKREVRESVLRRADGVCEYCGTAGFLMHDGRIYLETHHVIPLFEDGADTVGNVVALCPNDHRRAHYGADRVAIRDMLLNYLTSRSIR